MSNNVQIEEEEADVVPLQNLSVIEGGSSMRKRVRPG